MNNDIPTEANDNKEKEEVTHTYSLESFIGNSELIEEPQRTFNDFIQEIQLTNEPLRLNWESKERKEDYHKKKNANLIIHKELQQIDYSNPLAILSPLYQSEYYHLSLLQNEIKEIKNILSEESVIKIIERRESCEMLKKIISYFLNFIVKKNGDLILNSLNCLKPIEISNTEALLKIQQSRAKMKTIKKYYMLNSSKIVLKKNKYTNLMKGLNFLKEMLYKNYKKVKELKLKNSTYIQFYKDNCSLQNKLLQLSDEFPKVKAIDYLIEKLKHKNDKFTYIFNADIRNLFEEKKLNYYELYCLFAITKEHGISNESITLFVQDAIQRFKKKSKSIILSTFYSYSDSNKSTTEPPEKITEIPSLKYDEIKFIECFKQTLLYLKNLSEMYVFYCSNKERTEWPVKLSAEFKSKKAVFYGYIDKHLSKLVTCSNFILRQFNNKKNTLIFLNSLCLFEGTMKILYNVVGTKYLPLAMKNLVLDQIKYENVKNIKKVGILLSGDMWEKTELEDSIDLFSKENIEEKAPLYLRNYLTLFNDSKKRINKTNFASIFEQFFANITTQNEDVYYLPSRTKENTYEEVNILSKPLNLSKLILSSSSISIIRGFFDLILDLLFYDDLVFEIFFQIFNLYDYFIFASLNMIITDKKYLNDLIQDLNFEEIKKKERLEYGSEMTTYQQKYANFRKLFISTKQKLEILFQKKGGIDIEKNCTNFDNTYEMNQFFLPKLSSQVELEMEGSTSINDKFASSFYYESLMVIESLHSIFKIIKRLEHFKSKIELEFQSGFISETINNYKLILKEAGDFIYRKLAIELINFEPIRQKILDYKWDPAETEADTQLFDASPFINDIIIELRIVYSHMGKIKKLPLKIQQKLIDSFIQYVIESVMEAFARLKRCNPTGRSIMLKDLKFLKQRIEDLVKTWGYKMSFDSYFSLIMNYVNAWYYGCDDLYSFLFDNNIEYKYWLGISNTSPIFNDLPRRQRKDFTQKVEDRYYSDFEKIISNLSEDK